MERFVPVTPGIVAERFLATNPEFVCLDAERRG